MRFWLPIAFITLITILARAQQAVEYISVHTCLTETWQEIMIEADPDDNRQLLKIHLGVIQKVEARHGSDRTVFAPQGSLNLQRIENRFVGIAHLHSSEHSEDGWGDVIEGYSSAFKVDGTDQAQNLPIDQIDSFDIPDRGPGDPFVPNPAYEKMMEAYRTKLDEVARKYKDLSVERIEKQHGEAVQQCFMWSELKHD
jgi:hypothetical protein